MRTYHVYVMASRSRVLYVGVTNDLPRRVDEHKRGLTPGFTSRYREIKERKMWEDLAETERVSRPGEAT
jgi:predicted GIY-YIG superfamily endonuclease